MSDRNSPFTGTELRPERIGGGAGQVFNITSSSASPTRIVGRTDHGLPVEETVPAAYSRLFVGLDGCVKDVPMRTAAVFSMEPEAERYELLTLREIILAGQFPLEACPYGTEYRHITQGPLVRPPKGVDACDGSRELVRDESGHLVSGGCEHMRALIEKRKAESLARHQATQNSAASMTNEQAEKLMALAGKAFGDAFANADPKARLKAGKSDA